MRGGAPRCASAPPEKRRYDPRYVEFLDDVFTVDKAWLEVLKRVYWMVPVVVLLGLGVLFVVASQASMPFTYTLF